MKRPRRFYEARARIARALAHPSRLLMLDALKERELCVCELTDLVGADQSTVSKHLAILKDAGIIEHRRQGTMHFYSLRVRCLDQFFGCLESVLEKDLKARRRELVGRG
ncbi:MAG: ArsR/SmtB family transcription factor, partial [Planctomycetota bacterium]